MIHKYSAKNIQQCIGERKIVFVGDSQVRQIFGSLATKLTGQQAENDIATASKHSDQFIKGPDNLELEFIWDPYLNSSTLFKELTMASFEEPSSVGGNRSSIVVVGGGLWFAKNLEELSLQQFSESVDNILHTLGVYERNHSQLRDFPSMLPQRDHTDSLVIFAPAQAPLYASLDSAHARTLTPNRVEPLHQKLLQTSSQHRIPVLWAYDSMTNRSETYQPDGLHFTDDVVNAKLDLILNVKCNSFLTFANGYPMDKTCCSKYPPMTKTQIVFIYTSWSFSVVACLLPWMLATITAISKGNSTRNGQSLKQSDANKQYAFDISKSLPPFKISKAIAVLLLISCYCWLADRTHLFNKSPKQFTNEDFTALCLMTFFVGILSVRPSKAPTRQKSTPSDAPTDDLFLSRDQTDEWKGWMQIMILIYHYTGASKILWIYKIIRLLVAAYIFLTGYGHTMFFCTKADYSLKRVAGVLVRLNMLSCILPFAVETDYMFYYFAPLVSFWYLVVYATMAIGRSWNRTLLPLTLKIMTSAVVVTTVISWEPGVFQSIFLTLSEFCNIHWNAKDWQFRLELDKYIVYVGMLVAAYTATNKGKNTVSYSDIADCVKNITSKAHETPFMQSVYDSLKACFKDKIFVYLSMTCGSCLFYALFAYPTLDKEAHNKIFPVASFGPILAFIAIRNSFPWARRFYSSIFAWIGRNSLETFILQFHIWLAADTKGLLTTGLFDRNQKKGRWLDFTLLTMVFLWMSWHAADAIQILTAYIVNPKPAQQCETSGVSLPITRSDEVLRVKSPRERANHITEGTAKHTPGRLVRLNTISKNFMSESLWARLILIMLVMWGLNMLK